MEAFALFVAFGFNSSHLSYLSAANTTGFVNTPYFRKSSKKLVILFSSKPNSRNLFLYSFLETSFFNTFKIGIPF